MFAGLGGIAFTVAKWLLGADGVIGKGFDLATAKVKAGSDDLATLSAEKRTVLIEAIRGDTARLQVQQNLILAAMTHPIWWWAWALFVFPVGFYHAAIFVTSTVPWLNGWTILRVPATQEAWALSIIQTIFVAQVGTGIAGAVAQSINSIFKK